MKPPRPAFGRTSRLLDSLIGVVSPSRALARVKARALMTAAVAAYESAAYGTSVWGTLHATSASPDVLLHSSLITIRDRCRHAYRNYCTARAVVEGQIAQMIGTGVSLVPKTGDDAADEICSDELEDFLEYADATGYGTVYEQQRLCVRMEYLAGNSFTQLLPRPELVAQGKIPVELMPLHPAQLSVDPVETVRGADFRNGVEIDDRGKPIAYHFTDNPGDWIIPQLTTEEVVGVIGIRTRPKRQRIPAELILHTWIRGEPGQAIGEPQLQPALSRIHDENELVAAELTTAKMGTAPGVFIKSKGPAGGLGTGSANQDASGNTMSFFEPGMIARLMDNEEIGTVENKRPSQLISLFRDMLRGDIAGATRTSQRWIDRNYGRANYSSMRADNQDSERLVTPEQHRFGRQFMGGLWTRTWPMIMVMAGVKVPREPRALRRFTRYELVPEGTPYVNPKEDVESALMAIDGGLSTYDEELGKRGKNRRRTLAAWMAEQKTPAVKEIMALRATAKPAAATGDPAADPAAAGAESVQDTAMNGAQVEALQGVLLAVASGQLQAEAAKLMIEAAFPYLDDDKVSEMVSSAAASRGEAEPDPSDPAEAGEQQGGEA